MWPELMSVKKNEHETESDLRKWIKYLGAKVAYVNAGEKDFEEFYTDKETLVMDKFESPGIIKNPVGFDEEKLARFTETIARLKQKGDWTREELINLFNWMIPNFNHKETGKFLDGRM